MESTEEYQTTFHQAGQHFIAYFLRYACEHRDNWAVLETDYTNLLTVAQYCRDADNHSDLLTLRDVLQPHLDLQGRWNNSLSLNEWAIAAAQTCSDRVSAVRFTHDQANILHQRGEYCQAEQLYRSNEDAYSALGESEMALRSRHMRALVVRAQGRLAEAEHLCETTIVEARRLGMEHWLAHPLYVRALLARDQGDFRRAHRYIEESLNRLIGSDELAMIAQCHHFLGELALWRGCLDEARSQLEKSLELSQQAGILRRVVATQGLLGDLAQHEGQYDKAGNLYRQAFGTAIRLGDRPQMARLSLSQAGLMTIEGLEQDAISTLRDARVIYQDIGDPRGVVLVSLLSARLYLKHGQFGQVVRMGVAALKMVRLVGLRPKVLLGVIRRRGKW